MDDDKFGVCGLIWILSMDLLHNLLNLSFDLVNFFGKDTDELNGMFQFQGFGGHNRADGRKSGVTDLNGFIFLVVSFRRSAEKIGKPCNVCFCNVRSAGKLFQKSVNGR